MQNDFILKGFHRKKKENRTTYRDALRMVGGERKSRFTRFLIVKVYY